MLSKLVYIFLISMVPIIELRGAIPAGLALGVPFYLTFFTALVGNLLPVPILILFTRTVFNWLQRKSQWLGRFVARMEKKAASKEELLKKYELFGLFLLVAIPLPGTGAWTGCLVAALFDIRLKNAFPAILLGVFTAGVIVTLLSYGVSIFLL